MDCQLKKKARITNEDKEDRISCLTDGVIHQILKSVDTKLAVQTSVLSKRWKLVWTTLPFLKFKWDDRWDCCKRTNKVMDKFARHVLRRRNHQSCISYLELAYLPPGLFGKFVDYAISRNVQHLNILFRQKHKPYKLSNFNSSSLQKLEMRMELDDSLLESDCWDLPALTTLHLKSYLIHIQRDNFPEICVTRLPALRTLILDDWDLLSFSFSLPALTTLRLISCHLPQKVWNFPALKSLEFNDVVFPKNLSDIFAALVSLQNLTLSFSSVCIKDCSIPCPQLMNLEIKTSRIDNIMGSIVVLAPKLRNFTSVGIFTITFGDLQLDSVYMKLWGWMDRREYYHRFKHMLPGLGSAKILNLDLGTIEALSLISNFLASPSPFYNLKYVKLPHGCNEASISSSLRSYLLSASPTATIVTTLPQNIISCRAAASLTAQNVVLQEPLAAPTEVLVNSENIHKTVCVDTVDMGVQEEHVVQNSVVHADRAGHVGSLVKGIGNDRVSSSSGNSNLGFWRGHEVNSEFVCLLDLIMNKYPETFEHFTTKTKKFCTMKLNMLCTSVNDFTKISVTEVDTEMIAEYRDVFADLKKLGFNVSWLVSRLNFIEKLRFSQPLLPELHALDLHINDSRSKLQDMQIRIDDVKTKLQDLQTLRDEKMQEIQKAFGTMGTNLAVGYIGDDLLSILSGP